MAAYSNRTDLAQTLPVSAPKSKTYGEAKASLDKQKIVPMGNPDPIIPPQPVARPRPPLVPLSEPSQRPDEPITAGAPFGPGPGPLQAGIPLPPAGVDNTIEALKAIYQAFPNDDLADLLDSAIREGY